MQLKYVPRHKLTGLIKTLKKHKKKIVFTNGCFDLIHPGHIKLLKTAKKKADILILGINSDRSIKRIKGKQRPILDEKSRVQVLSSIIYINYITVFSEPTPLKTIKKIKPDILVKGADWEKEDIVGSDFVQKSGGRILRVPLKKEVSTTSLIKKIKKI